MQITKVTQLGNSDAVVLASPLMREAKWHRGQKVSINYIPDADSFLIRRVKKAQTPKRAEKEFQNWLTSFLKEDAQLLDELAHR
ncbi:MAG: hypothetical protein NTY06_00450 [Candidatus Gottesmanbacteria bacterium]|nr:hypothetical protein [Candidatus Gottesmanbacteria bacterium]